MRHVPWITLIIAAAFALSPFGQSLYHSAFVSGEQLANSLSQFLLMVILAIAAALGLLEWGVKYFLHRRARNRAGA